MVINQDKEKSFAISLTGAKLAGELQTAESLLKDINDNDDLSIIKACQLVNYDMVYRAGSMPKEFKIPDQDTINNIKSLINRSLSFFNQIRSEEHTSELQSRFDLVCRLLLEK